MTIQTPEQIADQIMKESTGGGYSPSIRKMMIAAIEADRRQLEHGEHIEPDYWPGIDRTIEHYRRMRGIEDVNT